MNPPDPPPPIRARHAIPAPAPDPPDTPRTVGAPPGSRGSSAVWRLVDREDLLQRLDGWLSHVNVEVTAGYRIAAGGGPTLERGPVTPSIGGAWRAAATAQYTPMVTWLEATPGRE